MKSYGMMLNYDTYTMNENMKEALAGKLIEKRGTCTINYKVFIIPHKYYKVPDLENIRNIYVILQ